MIERQKGDRIIVRAVNSGVFFGEFESREGSVYVLRNARRLWFWSGAASLSQLAMQGVKKPLECKFPMAVDRVEIFDVCEILDTTKEAQASIDGVPVWAV